LKPKIIHPAPRGAWAAIAQQDPHALIFQTPAWTDSLCATGRYQDASRMYETDDGQILILPLVRTTSMADPLGSLASMPDGWGLGGLLSNRPVQPEHVYQVLADLAEVPALRTTIRANPLGGPAWLAAQSAGYQRAARSTHILKLDGGFARIWSERFATATRTNLRKAEKSDLEVECVPGDGKIGLFYQLYERWLERRADERHIPRPMARWLGKRREPLYKFEHVARTLQETCQVWTAYLEDEPIASAILLRYRQHAFFWRGTSLKEQAGPVRANDLLQQRMIEAACQAGCRFYHMGESGGVASLVHYKARFGAEEVPYGLYYRERLPLTATKNWLNRLARRIRQAYPRSVALGSVLVG